MAGCQCGIIAIKRNASSERVSSGLLRTSAPFICPPLCTFILHSTTPPTLIGRPCFAMKFCNSAYPPGYIGILSFLISSLLGGVIAGESSSAATPQQTNFVIINFDDAGNGDFSYLGAVGYQTPVIDNTVANGLNLTNFFAVQPISGASSAGLTTGCYPNRIGFAYATNPNSPMGISAISPNGQIPDLPLIEGNKVVEYYTDKSKLTRDYTTRAVDFIKRSGNKPFFLYPAHAMPHVPQAASYKFKDKSEQSMGSSIFRIQHSWLSIYLKPG